MAYQYGWEIKGHVLYVRYWGDLSVEELALSIDELVAELVGSGAPFVNVISDVRDVTRPVPLVEIAKLMRHYQRPEQMGWSITVGQKNPFITFSNAVASQILGQRMRSFDAKEQALAFLKESDPSINWNSKEAASSED